PPLFPPAAPLRAPAFARARIRPWAPSPNAMLLVAWVGAVAAAFPLLLPSAWLVPLVWTGLVLVLEPLNARAGRPSWLADLARGDASRLVSLTVAGAICGVLWEFWNYWAITKWTYTVPTAYVGHVKVFEMPVIGYLCFL